MAYIDNIEKATKENNNFRKVIFTSHYLQIVLMSIPPGGEIGNEIHGVDQFFRFDAGQGELVLNNGSEKNTVSDGFAVVVPAGTWHNIVNTSQTEDLKLYTIYTPPHHKNGTIHETKEIAEGDHEEFDGVTSL